MKKKFTSLLAFVLLISLVLPAGTSFAAAKKPKLNMKKLNMTVGSTRFAFITQKRSIRLLSLPQNLQLQQ